MTQEHRHHLPLGLPISLDSPEMFERLCTYLRIEGRPHKQALLAQIKHTYPSLDLGPKKGVRTALRLREAIIRFYRDPSIRRDHWRTSVDKLQDDSLKTLPSLEHIALTAIDANYHTRSLSTDAQTDFMAELPDIVTDPSSLPDYKQLPLAHFPAVRSRLLNWDGLNSRERNEAILAVFSIATILDDVRVLEWAARQESTIASAFDHFVSADTATSQDPSQQIPTSNDLLTRWQQLCHTLSKRANRLVHEPHNVEAYTRLQQVVSNLDQFHNLHIDHFRRDFSEHHIRTFLLALDELPTKDDSADFVDFIRQVSAYWKRIYDKPTPQHINELDHETARVLAELTTATQEWRHATHQHRQYQEALDSLRNSKANLVQAIKRETEVQEKLHKTASLRQTLLDKLTKAASSSYRPFDPETDYCQPRKAEQPRPGTATDDTTSVSNNTPTVTSAPSHVKPSTSSPEPPESKPNPQDQPATLTQEARNQGDNQPNTKDDGNHARLTTKKPTVNTERQSKPRQPHPLVDKPSEVDVSPSPHSTDKVNEDEAIIFLWRSLTIRPSLSYHLALHLSRDNSNPIKFPPADLVAALILSKNFISKDAVTARALKEHHRQIDPSDFHSADEHTRTALTLLLFAATARSALVSPSTQATSLLRSLGTPNELKPLYDLATSIADHAEQFKHRLQLDASVCTAVLDQDRWDKQFASTRAEVKDWSLRARRQRILFKPANHVWKNWLHDSNILGSLVKLIIESTPAESEAISKIVDSLESDHDFRGQVQATYRSLSRTKGGQITGRALKQLRNHTEPLLNLARDWLRLVHARSEVHESIEPTIRSLHDVIQNQGPRAMQALKDLTEKSRYVHTDVALALAQGAIHSLCELFHPNGDEESPHLGKPSVALNCDLLYVTDLLLDSQFCPVDNSGSRVVVHLQSKSNHALTLQSAFETRLSNRDYIGAELVCSVMEALEEPNRQEHITKLEQTLSSLRIRLLRKISAHTEALEQSLRFGQLEITTADQLRSTASEISCASLGLEASDVSSR